MSNILRAELQAQIDAADRIGDSKRADAERLVLAHGREFVGVRRPKGFRLMRAKACHSNAWRLALEGRGDLVEGFSMCRSGGLAYPFHHSWVCLDDGSLVEPTLKDPEGHLYLGIRFRPELFQELMMALDDNPDFGFWGFLREPFVRQQLGDRN
jgi:hypothetical protein